MRQTFASEEKCLRPVKNVRAQPSRLEKNVCGLWKMFAPAEKCLRPMKNGAKKKKSEIKIKRKQLNKYKFQRSENQNKIKIENHGIVFGT